MINEKGIRGLRNTILIAFCWVFVSSCREASPECGEEPELRVRIVSGAYTASGTRVDYEYNALSGRRRVVWAEGDELQVAAFSDTGRVNSAGSLWSRFRMVTDGGFDKEYMLFAGDALVTQGAQGASKQRLYAFHPAPALNDTRQDAITFPAVQKYRAGSFDTDAVILVSAPVEVEIPEAGSVETPPFRMRHYTGYLQLFPKNLPAVIADETVAEITVESSSGAALSGAFRIGIDDHAAAWSLAPSGENSNRLQIDCSEAGVTVGELGECWFAMLPGVYGEVTFSISTVTGSILTMQRSGLDIRSGVVTSQEINFRSGDVLKKAVVIRLDGSDLGIGEEASYETGSGVKEDVEFNYTRVKYVVSGNEKLLELSRKGSKLWNVSPLPSRIVRVEVDHTDSFVARFTYVDFGASLSYELSQICSVEGVNCINAPADSDYRYVCIENRSADKVGLRSIKIICAPAD